MSTDLEVKAFFDILANTSSMIKKKELLAEKKNDLNVRQFLDYLLNPFFVTGISEKKINDCLKIYEKSYSKSTVDFKSFPELMSYIRENHTGSDEVLGNVKRYFTKVSPKLREFYADIITKSIRIGCDAKTVNDGLGFELIPIWDVQQAYRYDNVRLNDNEWFSLSQKLNGVRGTYFEGKIINRQGREITGLDHILDAIEELLFMSQYDECEEQVLDGELIRINDDDVSDNENFRITTGILNQEDGDKSSIQFVIFDVMPKKEFIRGTSDLPYKSRLSQLKDLDRRIREHGLDALAVVDILYSGTDKSMIDTYLDQMV
ncbi:MAG: hypothetical protein J6X92_05185, partial [Bacteroidales bacterium]|nr:hypothetical protein [Bacteroidales bacterium]